MWICSGVKKLSVTVFSDTNMAVANKYQTRRHHIPEAHNPNPKTAAMASHLMLSDLLVT